MPRKKDKPEPTVEQRLAEELATRAWEQDLSLTGPDGLLKQLTKQVLETAPSQEMTEHLSHDRHSPAGNAGVRHLLAAYNLGEDKLSGHIKPRKTRRVLPLPALPLPCDDPGRDHL